MRHYEAPEPRQGKLEQQPTNDDASHEPSPAW
jgi:hypothetical protein